MTHVWTSVAPLMGSITTLLVGYTAAQLAGDRTNGGQPVVNQLPDEPPGLAGSALAISALFQRYFMQSLTFTGRKQ